MPIKRLSVQLANQIAAGEVVERPSSVVKELMENAIDAHATSITLEIAKAGKTLIKVTDNGQGIPENELVLALAPHATSKISKLEDLDAITTLGFRGEALASIASVSKLTLVSCTQEQSHAFQVEVSGPEQNPDVQPAAHPVGTSVIVKELFFNTPARRRFLKADKTEFNHIKELFIRLALVNYHIAFRFVSDGKQVLFVPAIPKSELPSRIGKLLGLEFKREGMYFDSTERKDTAPLSGGTKTDGAESGHRGDESADGLEVSAGGTDANAAGTESNPGYQPYWTQHPEVYHDLNELRQPIMKLYGVLLPPPSMSQAIPDRLLTFLNGRVIADKIVNHAIKEGYIDSIVKMHDTYKPSVRGVIFMECDPHIVDVNVHPRKDEVRFHNSALIHDCIKSEIKSVLEAYGLNQQRVNLGVLAPSLVVDPNKLTEQIEVRPSAIDLAQQRLRRWQQTPMQPQQVRSAASQAERNVALQQVIDQYFAAAPLSLHTPVEQGQVGGPSNIQQRTAAGARTPSETGDANESGNLGESSSSQVGGFLSGSLCDLTKIRNVWLELDARKQAQKAYDRYHKEQYGVPAQLTYQTKVFIERAHPVIEAVVGTNLGPNAGNPDPGTDAQGNLQQAFELTRPQAAMANSPYASGVDPSARPDYGVSAVAYPSAYQAASQDVARNLSGANGGVGATDLSALGIQNRAGLSPLAAKFLQSERQRSLERGMLGTPSTGMLGDSGVEHGDTYQGDLSASDEPKAQSQVASSEILQAQRKAVDQLLDENFILGEGLVGTDSADSSLGVRVVNSASLNWEAQRDSVQDVHTLQPDYAQPVQTINTLGAAAYAQHQPQGGTPVDLQRLANTTHGLDFAGPGGRGTLAANGAAEATAQVPAVRTGAEDVSALAALSSSPQQSGGRIPERSRFLSLVAHDIILFILDNRYYVGRGSELYYSWAARDYARRVKRNQVESYELSMAFTVKVDANLLKALKQEDVKQAVKCCGFQVQPRLSLESVELKKIPVQLVGTNLGVLVPQLLSLIAASTNKILEGDCSIQLSQEIVRSKPFEITNEIDAQQLISKIDSPELLQGVRCASDIKELKLLNLALSMLQAPK